MKEGSVVKESYNGPKIMGGPVVKVLVADGSVDRSNQFRLHGNGYHFRIVRSSVDLERSLLKDVGTWDVLMHALYLGDWKEPWDHTLTTVKDAFYAGKLRGVICTSPIETDGIRFVSGLRAMGVPCKYYPFYYKDPATHKEVVVDVPLQIMETK